MLFLQQDTLHSLRGTKMPLLSAQIFLFEMLVALQLTGWDSIALLRSYSSTGVADL